MRACRPRTARRRDRSSRPASQPCPAENGPPTSWIPQSDTWNGCRRVRDVDEPEVAVAVDVPVAARRWSPPGSGSWARSRTRRFGRGRRGAALRTRGHHACSRRLAGSRVSDGQAGFVTSHSMRPRSAPASKREPAHPWIPATAMSSTGERPVDARCRRTTSSADEPDGLSSVAIALRCGAGSRASITATPRSSPDGQNRSLPSGPVGESPLARRRRSPSCSSTRRR